MAEFTSYQTGTPCWIDISSPDPAKTRAFYGALFGWEVQELGPEAGGYANFTLRNKLVAGSGPLMMPNLPPVWSTYVKVDDADEVAGKVGANGGTVFFPPTDVLNAGRLAMFADPTGVPLGIWQPFEHLGAQLANEPGSFTWNELHSRDVEAAKAFYRAVFGWSEQSVDFGGTPYTIWNIGESPVAGTMTINANVPSAVPGFWLVYFSVADTDAAVAKAEELGASVAMAAFDSPSGRFAVLNDNVGATFAVIQPPA